MNQSPYSLIHPKKLLEPYASKDLIVIDASNDNKAYDNYQLELLG